MATPKTIWYCNNCGHNSIKWLGKCPSCNEWNSFAEEVIQDTKSKHYVSVSSEKATKPQKLSEITFDENLRIQTADQELNRVLGGGIVLGSITLISGEPGIGKSTLMLQSALSLKGITTFYISGEESPSQVRMRAERLNMPLDNCYIYSETETSKIFNELKSHQPGLIIIDSVQTMYSALLDSAPGSVSQIKHIASEFMRYAKETGTPVFLVGHVTKDGAIAGPKILEHLVDTVLHFEGERHYHYRIIRALKNRFGSATEIGIYEMDEKGLTGVANPSEILLSSNSEHLAGIAIACTIEGNRPMMIEVQALVSKATFGTPQRSVTGFDTRRLNMLLAVLEKKYGFPLGSQDVFLNITGGLKTEDPAIDLAVCAAIISSYNDVAIPSHVCFSAEVGLGGEVRSIVRSEIRITEAERLGFKVIYLAETDKTKKHNNPQIKIRYTKNLRAIFANN